VILYDDIQNNKGKSTQINVDGIEITEPTGQDYTNAWNSTFFKKIIDANSGIMSDGGTGFGISTFKKPNSNTWKCNYNYIDNKTINSNLLGKSFEPTGDDNELLDTNAFNAMYLLYLNYLQSHQDALGLTGFNIPSSLRDNVFTLAHIEEITSKTEIEPTNKVKEQEEKTNTTTGPKY
jgi:hypothetical protein